MPSITAQLQRTHAERKAHIAALTRAATSEVHESLFQHLYGCLSILDAKAQSLLGFNSIILAVFAIFLTRPLSWGQSIAANAGMALILSSSLLLLSVVWIHWSTTTDLGDVDEHALRLLAVRNRRTLRYRVAWLLSVASLFALGLLLVALYIFGTQ